MITDRELIQKLQAASLHDFDDVLMRNADNNYDNPEV